MVRFLVGAAERYRFHSQQHHTSTTDRPDGGFIAPRGVPGTGHFPQRDFILLSGTDSRGGIGMEIHAERYLRYHELSCRYKWTSYSKNVVKFAPNGDANGCYDQRMEVFSIYGDHVSSPIAVNQSNTV